MSLAVVLVIYVYEIYLHAELSAILSFALHYIKKGANQRLALESKII